MTEKLKTAKWVSELLGVKIARVWELTREEKIPFIQIGERQYRYSETALMDWINGGGNREPETNKDFTK